MRDKIRKAATYLNQSFYVNTHDLIQCGEIITPAPILYSLIAGLTNGNVLLSGIPGTGKTTLAEAVGAICYSYQLKEVRESILHGHPEQTEEKMLGRPDLAELHKGANSREKVIWSPFAKIQGPKVIDEVNRLPPGKQNILLDAIDRGVFAYLGEQLSQENMSIFATMNYADKGNTPLIPPLRDRFDLSFELVPAAGLAGLVRALAKNKKVLESKKHPSFCFNHEDREEFREEVDQVKESEEFLLFLDYFSSEVSYDPSSGIQRPGEGDSTDNHYETLLTRTAKESMACRGITNGPVKYMKATAYLAEMREVTPEIAVNVLEYALPHRLNFRDGVLSTARELRKDDTRTAPIGQYCARTQLKALFERFSEHLPKLKQIHKFLKQNQKENVVECVKELKGVHPYFDLLHSMYTTQPHNITCLIS